MACSPGGKFLRSSAIFTPLPPDPSEIFAVPTSLPIPSFNVTVTGLFAASKTQPNKPMSVSEINALIISSHLQKNCCHSSVWELPFLSKGSTHFMTMRNEATGRYHTKTVESTAPFAILLAEQKLGHSFGGRCHEKTLSVPSF